MIDHHTCYEAIDEALAERFRVQDGWLTSRVSGERIQTPTEQSFFDLIGVPWLAPEERR